MRLKSLFLENFKNHHQTTFHFKEPVILFIGKNGTGKTNALDAIHYLCLTKSFLNYSDRQNIRFDQHFFTISGFFETTQHQDLEIFLSLTEQDKKALKKNNVLYDRLSDHIGLIPCVVVSPQDIDLITEGSELRRKLIDTVLSQIDTEYMHLLIKYNRALVQRNGMLKQCQIRGLKFEEEVWEGFEAILHDQGTQIYHKRMDFVKELIPLVQEAYKTISNDSEQASIFYESSLHHQNFLQELREKRTLDIQKQYTTQGIHRDDLLFSLQEKPLKKFSSQGQQKSFILALKFAFLQLVNLKTQKSPILLLDDIFDRLDSTRLEALLKMVTSSASQLFITDTESDKLCEILQKQRVSHQIISLPL